MFGTKLNILQYVRTILDIETKVYKLFLSQGIYPVGTIIHTNYDIYQ